MKVTLDTNILVQDFWLDSPHSKVFLNELQILPATLHISQIVIDETVNKFKEALTEKLKDFQKVSNELTRQIKKDTLIFPVDIKEETNRYRDFLNTKCKDLKVEVLPYPDIEHEKVVRHILDRRRPFKKGDAGYRDFLIWQSIKRLELWGSEEIVFITNNTKDFGEEGYISEEFIDKVTGNKNFKISNSLYKFNEDYIVPRLKKLKELKKQLENGQVTKFSFKNWLDTEFIEFIKEVEFEEVLMGFPYGVGKVRANEILLYDDFEIDDVRQLNSGEKLVHFTVKCKINAYVDIEWEDYVNHKEVRDYYGETKNEFGSSSGMDTGNIEVQGYLILDKLNEEVKEFEVTYLEGPGGGIDGRGT